MTSNKNIDPQTFKKLLPFNLSKNTAIIDPIVARIEELIIIFKCFIYMLNLKKLYKSLKIFIALVSINLILSIYTNIIILYAVRNSSTILQN